MEDVRTFEDLWGPPFWIEGRIQMSVYYGLCKVRLDTFSAKGQMSPNLWLGRQLEASSLGNVLYSGSVCRVIPVRGGQSSSGLTEE